MWVCPTVHPWCLVYLVSVPDPHWESGSKTNMHVLCVCGVHVWAFACVSECVCVCVSVCECVGVSEYMSLAV